jgi:hypothetical protein
MSEWQPIETAPKDGTRVLITDGTLMTAAKWWYYEEPATTSLGYGDPKTGVPEGGWPKHPGHIWSMDDVPNPSAGKRRWSWYQDNPIAFSEDDGVGPDYDGHFDDLKPTHWMPLPEPPALAKAHHPEEVLK